MKNAYGLGLMVSLFLLVSTGCKKGSEEEPAANKSSSHGSTISHNMGQACMPCHSPGGSGSSEGLWILAGTVYTKDGSSVNPNGTIYLWSGASGTGNLLATLEVDGNGNFYTTSSILPAAGAYMQIKGTSGDIQNMPVVNVSGNCLGCHGVSAPKIWVN